MPAACSLEQRGLLSVPSRLPGSQQASRGWNWSWGSPGPGHSPEGSKSKSTFPAGSALRVPPSGPKAQALEPPTHASQSLLLPSGFGALSHTLGRKTTHGFSPSSFLFHSHSKFQCKCYVEMYINKISLTYTHPIKKFGWEPLPEQFTGAPSALFGSSNNSNLVLVLMPRHTALKKG